MPAMVALIAAVLQAWPIAAACGSSSAADLAMYTLAAQRAVTFTSETLAPTIAYAEPIVQNATQAVAVRLMLSDDVLLLLLVNLALLNQQVEGQQQQQDAPYKQLLQAVGLHGLLLPASDAAETEQPVVTSTAGTASSICDAVMALRAVILLRAGQRKKLGTGKLGDLLAAHKPQQSPAVRIDLAAVWQPLLQIALQLPLTEAAAGVDGDGVKGGCLNDILTSAIHLAYIVFTELPAEVLQRSSASLNNHSQAPPTTQLICSTVVPLALGRLAPLVLQQLQQSERQAKQDGAATGSSSSNSGPAQKGCTGNAGSSSSSSSSRRGRGSTLQANADAAAHTAASSSNSSSDSSNMGYGLSRAWANLVISLFATGELYVISSVFSSACCRSRHAC
jgi:hypothetical protein